MRRARGARPRAAARSPGRAAAATGARPTCAPATTPIESATARRIPCPWAKLPCGDVRERADAAHHREHEVRGRRRDVRWKAEGTHEQRYVDDAAADAEEARHETDHEAVGGASQQRHVVLVEKSLPVGEQPPHDVSPCRLRRPALAGEQPDGEQCEHAAHQPVEDVARDGADDERAADRAGKRREREHGAAAEVGPPLPRVRHRPRRRVEEHDGETDRGERARRVVRVEQEQDRREDEAAARPDDGSERADAEAEQREQNGCRRVEVQLVRH